MWSYLNAVLRAIKLFTENALNRFTSYETTTKKMVSALLTWEKGHANFFTKNEFDW